jgi:RNA polymerase sigma-70 factor (ECF subfamily)
VSPTEPSSDSNDGAEPGAVKMNLQDSSDAQLIVQIGRYEQAALAEAYRRHGGSVAALAQRLIRRPDMAEEVVQEIFVRLWNNPERFDPDRGSLRAFLLSQTHGRSIDLIRSEEARKRREDRDHQRTVDAGYDLEHEVMDLAVATRVKDALKDLPEGERSAIVMAYFGGYTYREAAEILGEPEGTVKSRIRSGLKKLRGSLVDVGGEPHD